MAEKTINELFAQYKKTGDIALRNQIAEQYLYIADILAKKFVGRGVEFDDLKQVASLALLKGIDRFDPDMQMQFTTFITPTITGEIKNYFRDKSRMIKLPRRLGEVNAKIKEFVYRYQAEYGGKPPVKIICDELGFSQEEVVRAMEVSGTVSLDSVASTGEDETTSLYAVIPDESDEFEGFETREALKSAMQDFSDVEKKLIGYRFVEALSQSETAKRLGVSQMYVSRLERALLTRLKSKLKNSI